MKRFITTSLLALLLIITVNLKQVVAQPADCVSDIHTADINETSLHYIECGEGVPVVLVHGTLGDYRNWIGSMQHFSQNYKVKVPNNFTISTRISSRKRNSDTLK